MFGCYIKLMDFELLLKKCPLLTRVQVLGSMANMEIKASNKILCVISVENAFNSQP